MIDLRSDTTSKPTPEMREAMARAEVGDDVLGDDPTVKRLEARVAEILGKEAAIYTPSGTMANQIALRCHLRPGDWFVVEADSHVLRVEGAATAGLANVAPSLVEGRQGRFGPEDVIARVPRPHPSIPDWLAVAPKLVWIENTHNGAGGTVWPLAELAKVAAAARKEGMAVHLDGARIWNAAVATGTPEAEFAAHCDTISVCFSKGLGAPIGSALAGPAETIREARRYRAAYGGGMRQAGIIAAGALHALENHRARLAEDHANARLLAEGLAKIDGIALDLATVESNIVVFHPTEISASTFVDRAEEAGVRMLPLGANTVRAVTCLDVSRADIEHAIEIIAALDLGA